VVVPGSSILQLISTNEIWVSAWVDETAMAGLAWIFAGPLFCSSLGREAAGQGRPSDGRDLKARAQNRLKVLL